MYGWGLDRMRISCLHGYFIFDEERPGEISEFMSYYGLTLVAKDNYFVPEALQDAPDYSIKAGSYLSGTAIKSFAGKPWEVMEANSIVYDFADNLIKPISSIIKEFSIKQTGFYFVSNGLIQPGSITNDGKIIKSYRAWFSMETLKFRYSEVEYV